ncbi:unnamed protein product [Brassicogethes aeneus]|uniref:Uncharacterized protein n=1 Tax=Brassicogethes aeneus TaxID=1431903 RepID=A0A9P0B2J4_BRAAE|nr:unnamed protein product [Brassicogethes aeneus]
MYWIILIIVAVAAANQLQPLIISTPSFDILPPIAHLEAQETVFHPFAVLPSQSYPNVVSVTPKPVRRIQNVASSTSKKPSLSVYSVSPANSYYEEKSKFVVPSSKYYTYGNVIPILHSSYDSDSKGNYKFGYQTGNEIYQQEIGRVKDSNSIEKSGGVSYKSPEGKTITLNYIADENGFRPAGDHLPTPPPIPEAILRSIRYNALRKSLDDGQYQPDKYSDDDGQYHPELYEAERNFDFEPVGSGQELILTYTLPDMLTKDNLRKRADNVVPTDIWFPK